MTPLIVLLACAGGPPGSSDVTFTEDSVLAPTLARLDTDGDGKVNAEEYGRVAFKGPTFAQVDVDSDGAISLAELRTIVLEQDPEKYFPERKHPMRGAKDGHSAAAGMPGMGQGGPGKGGRGPGKGGVGGKGHRKPTFPPPSLLVIQVLCEELLAADPAATACVDTEVLRIGEGGSLQTAEAQAFLAKLEAASDAAKLGFPTTLRAANAPPPAAPTAVAPAEGAPAPKIAEP